MNDPVQPDPSPATSSPPPIPPPTSGSVFEVEPLPNQMVRASESDSAMNPDGAFSGWGDARLHDDDPSVAHPNQNGSVNQGSSLVEHPGGDRALGSTGQGNGLPETATDGPTAAAAPDLGVPASTPANDLSLGSPATTHSAPLARPTPGAPAADAGGLVLRHGPWFCLGSDADDLRGAIDELHEASVDAPTVQVLEATLRARASVLALARSAAGDPALTVCLRAGSSARIMRDGVATHHLVSDGAVNILVIDRPFDSVAISGSTPGAGTVSGLSVPDSGSPEQGYGVVFFGAADEVGGDVASLLGVAPSLDEDEPQNVGAGLDARPGVAGGPTLALDGQLWPVADEVVIGSGPFRGPTDDVAVNDPFLDAIHAGFLVTSDGIHLADLRSKSGTYLRTNADERWVRVDPEQPVLLGRACDIRAGRTTFRYQP